MLHIAAWKPTFARAVLATRQPSFFANLVSSYSLLVLFHIILAALNYFTPPLLNVPMNDENYAKELYFV